MSEGIVRGNDWWKCPWKCSGEMSYSGFQIYLSELPLAKFGPYQVDDMSDKVLLQVSVVQYSVGPRVTEDLPKLPGCSYRITVDNLFTSLRLLRLLAYKGMTATGTSHFQPHIKSSPAKRVRHE